MKKRFIDWFRKSYQAKFSARPLVCQNEWEAQLFGFSLLSGSEGTLSCMEELHAGVLRFSAEDPNRERILDFCQKHGFIPHCVFSTEKEIAAVCEQVSVNPSECCFYELAVPAESVPFESDEAMDKLCGELLRLGEMVREKDPAGKLIFPLFFPFGGFQGRADVWNDRVFRNCAESADFFGVSACVLPADEIPDDEMTERVCALAEEWGQALTRLARRARTNGTMREIPLALTGCGLKKNPLTRTDCFFYASLWRRVRELSEVVTLCEVEAETGVYEFLKLLKGEQRFPLACSAVECRAEVFSWAEVSASCSPDGRRVFLLAANHHPYRRADIRVGFEGLREMRPEWAAVLRADPESGAPLAAEIPLRKYRPMDHVNLDIAPGGIASMVLVNDGE